MRSIGLRGREVAVRVFILVPYPPHIRSCPDRKGWKF